MTAAADETYIRYLEMSDLDRVRVVELLAYAEPAAFAWCVNRVAAGGVP